MAGFEDGMGPRAKICGQVEVKDPQGSHCTTELLYPCVVTDTLVCLLGAVRVFAGRDGVSHMSVFLTPSTISDTQCVLHAELLQFCPILCTFILDFSLQNCET